MNRLLSTLSQYGDRVGSYEALSEVCSGVKKPEIRKDFMHAVAAALSPNEVSQMTAVMDRGYQGWCRGSGYSVCPQGNLKIAQTRYQELMSVLASGDLQRTREGLVARDASTQQDPVQNTASKSDPPFTGWILFAASHVGSYQALSESCSDKEEAAIRDDFLAIVGELSAERATDITRHMDGQYVAVATAQKNWHILGRGCPENKLRNWEIKYQKIINDPRTANWRDR
jgi:predicted secreted protein